MNENNNFDELDNLPEPKLNNNKENNINLEIPPKPELNGNFGNINSPVNNNELNEIVNINDLFKTAEASLETTYDKLPADNYVVNFESIERLISKSGKDMLRIIWNINEGKRKNSKIIDNIILSGIEPGFLQSNLNKLIGIAVKLLMLPNNFQNIADILNTINSKIMEIQKINVLIEIFYRIDRETKIETNFPTIKYLEK